MSLRIKAFFDEPTFMVSYVVADNATKTCAVIDSVLGFDENAGRTNHVLADKIIDYVHSEDLAVELILETHAHADHLSAAAYLKSKIGGRTAIGARIVDVQKIFAKVFNLGAEFAPDGRQFDLLLTDGDVFKIGDITGKAIHTPGHTPACMTYLIEDAAFVGDTMFMPDYGTARADFPGGDARLLYRSIRRILALPEATRLFLCHDYKAPGRQDYVWETTVAEQRAKNIHVHDGIEEAAFAAMRVARDKTLEMPRLILPSIQVNIRAGGLPAPENNGVSYLKLPVNGF